jgi:hypothetical protein
VKIHNSDDNHMSFDYEHLNMSIVNMKSDSMVDDEWISMSSTSNITEQRSIVIELNRRVLHNIINTTIDYRIVETIFSNFNLFPQSNCTQMGMPISYQIGNYTRIDANEDLIRFRIRLEHVR